MNAEILTPTTREIRSQIEPDAHQRSTLIGVSSFLVCVFLYVATAVACVSTPWWLAIPAMLLNGTLIGILFIIGHDACHGVLVPQRWLNHTLGRLAFLPSLTPFTSWQNTHNYRHHGFTNLRDLDYTWQPLSLPEYESSGRVNQLMQRCYRTTPGLALKWLIDTVYRHLFFPTQSDWDFLKKRRFVYWDRIVVFAYLIFNLTALTWACHTLTTLSLNTSFLWATLAGFVCPFTVWCQWVGLVIYIQHTHPDVIWFKDKEEWSFYGGQIQSTAYIALPWPLNRIFLDVMEHNAHHVDPGIPFYRLLRQQKTLVDKYGHDIPTQKLTHAFLCQLYRTCQLYDYENHCWLSFSGVPTTPPRSLKPTSARQDHS